MQLTMRTTRTLILALATLLAAMPRVGAQTIQTCPATLPIGGPDPMPMAGASTSSFPGDRIIDLLVVYTDEVLAAHGGEGAVLLEVAEPIRDAANRAYAQSGIDMEVRLVGVRRVAGYAEQGTNLSLELENLSKLDNSIDQVLTWRNELGADFVHMVVEMHPERGNAVCGRGYAVGRNGTPGAGGAFSVSNRRAPSFTCHPGAPVHEMAHNMGIGHGNIDEPDLEFDWTCQPIIDPETGLQKRRRNAGALPDISRTNYAHGWRDPGGAFETYNLGAQWASGAPFEYFSNPTVNVLLPGGGSVPIGSAVGGVPCPGFGAADGARAISEVRSILTGFRTNTIPIPMSPGGIYLVDPANGGSVAVSTPILLQWGVSTPFAPYSWQVTNAAGTVASGVTSVGACAPIDPDDSTSDRACSATVPSLPSGTYTWSVSATNSAGTTASEVWQFVVGSGGIACTAGEIGLSRTPTSPYPGEPTTFVATNVQPGSTPQWSFDDGVNMAGMWVTRTFNDSGFHTVALTGQQNGCTSTVAAPVTSFLVRIEPDCTEIEPGRTAPRCRNQGCNPHACPAGVNGPWTNNCGDVVECGTLPNGPTCGAMGGEECMQGGQSCGSGYTSLGSSYLNGAVECTTCCNLVDVCASSSAHEHSGSCGSSDSCGHVFGSPNDCLQTCGGMGGDYCSQTPGYCPGGYTDMGPSAVNGGPECASCCDWTCQSSGCPAGEYGWQQDNCGSWLYCGDACDSPNTHDHWGACGEADSCGHSFGSDTDCGCPNTPWESDTCYQWTCQEGWNYVTDYCTGTNYTCDWIESCWDECGMINYDEWSCWTQCGGYWGNCQESSYEYECGGHWENYQYGCYDQPYACNWHRCGW